MIENASSSHASRDRYEFIGPETVCEAVTDAVAAAEQRSPIELDPLYEAADGDALDALFTSTENALRAGTVQFRYHGYWVTVSVADEKVTVVLDERSA